MKQAVISAGRVLDRIFDLLELITTTRMFVKVNMILLNQCGIFFMMNSSTACPFCQ